MSGGQVNHLLHTLRGEDFRHSLNVRKARARLTSNLTHNSPTLPIDLIDHQDTPPESSLQDEELDSVKCLSRRVEKMSPKSWLQAYELKEARSWRADALSLIFNYIQPNIHEGRVQSSVPRLTLLCLQALLSFSVDEFTDDIVPYIPPHLRRNLIRWASVHSPLPKSKLYALCQPDGHADGELIIVGPSATLRDDYFMSASKEERESSWDWDGEDRNPIPLQTLILVSTRLSSSTLFTLPPTITHMALINLPFSIPVHRLPNVCPLLVFLDLSYNSWLASGTKDTVTLLERIDWSRWNQLRTLGFRHCYIPDGMPARMNKGRWDDVEIIQ